ncbi:hypothetical protein [Arthrobacter sp. ISL-65]|uniref:hypothetical protein n=1 Tax=Arthrobacter sp. ISL-65 TaxID=2819112 RepID=UPI001BE90F03|nr:hypothetical protein [Arthrobacter sp. ISL-65]MBT2550582.1 hypothetical protein [Arthrobacter sp. ISL-65]
MVLAQKTNAGRTKVLPVLAYPLLPVVSFRENGGELTSALVSFLPTYGFQLAMSPDYSAILEQAAEQTSAHCRFTYTPRARLELSIAGEILHREQFDQENADDAAWL